MRHEHCPQVNLHHVVHTALQDANSRQLLQMDSISQTVHVRPSDPLECKQQAATSETDNETKQRFTRDPVSVLNYQPHIVTQISIPWEDKNAGPLCPDISKCAQKHTVWTENRPRVFFKLHFIIFCIFQGIFPSVIISLALYSCPLSLWSYRWTAYSNTSHYYPSREF